LRIPKPGGSIAASHNELPRSFQSGVCGRLPGTRMWRNLTPARGPAGLPLSDLFRRFARVLINLFANDTLRGFVEIGVESRL
jgi:hypothetical protein